jgi:hypothetical protein
MIPSIPTLLLLRSWCAVSCALAAPGVEAPHGPVLAGRAIGSVAVERGATETLAGGGVALETAPSHHVAVELTLGKQVHGSLSEVPVEVVVQRVFELGDHVEPYLGLGPALVVRTDREVGSELRAGGVGVLGTHVWLGHDWGVLLETDVVCTHGGEWLSTASEAKTGLIVRLH